LSLNVIVVILHGRTPDVAVNFQRKGNVARIVELADVLILVTLTLLLVFTPCCF